MASKKEAKRLAKLAEEKEALKKSKREELKREIASQASKKGEMDRSWRELILKIKEPIFRQDIEVMWQTFNRAIDKKDHLINSTMKLMDIADDQFQRTVASFCDTIDTMINKFLDDLNELSRDNEIRTAELLTRGEIDAQRIMTDHNAAETHLQLLLYHSNTTADSLAWTTRGENFVKQDEERMKFANERENLRSLLEDKFNNLWDEFKGVLKNYVVETAANQKQVRKLRFKENLMADIIASQAKKIANSGGMLKRLRTELAAYESGTKQAVFRDRRNRHRAACHKLKKRLISGCSIDVKQLAILVKSSDSTVAWLNGAVKKGEKILRMAALCRKYETQREKVLPYGCTLPRSPSELKDIVRQKSHTQNDLVAHAINSTSGLTRLWQLIAKAELTKRALYYEKILLIQENEDIMLKIQEHNDKKFEPPQPQQCLCNSDSKKKAVVAPVAIEGVLELSKYR